MSSQRVTDATVSRAASSGTYAGVPAGAAATAAITTGGVVKVTGPTLPTLTAGTKYVWEQTDASGVLLDIIYGTA